MSVPCPYFIAILLYFIAIILLYFYKNSIKKPFSLTAKGLINFHFVRGKITPDFFIILFYFSLGPAK
ncbi:hypothetical protein CVT91_10610 [Candidatus Atribacteria bacterium HGW-Atribacteria-1]|nr:MAG: hypothetical protein CVT91_10610 [Candidatus Atribacteria bacterium HGW-Atribacteria-1]